MLMCACVFVRVCVCVCVTQCVCVRVFERVCAFSTVRQSQTPPDYRLVHGWTEETDERAYEGTDIYGEVDTG